MDIGPFASMLEKKQLPQVARGIEHAVVESFKPSNQRLVILPGEMRNPTSAEMRRRVGMCVDICRTLRGDLKWSVSRILDHLPRYLRMKLDGQDINPEQESSHWMPESDIK